MKVTHNTPELLVLRFTRWKGPFAWSLVALSCLYAGWSFATVSGTALVIWLAATVTWMIPLALFLAERSMLVLDASCGRADLTHRTWRGLTRLHWPLDEVQSTRVLRRRRHGPAIKDPKREIMLYVREGMDEGRYLLANHQVRADDALTASALVSAWMKAWRGRIDSGPPQA